MKSRIKNEESKGNIYPNLGVTYWEDQSKIVVLFKAEGEGTVVFSNSSVWRLGESNDTWNMKAFTPFTGIIELSNE